MGNEPCSQNACCSCTNLTQDEKSFTVNDDVHDLALLHPAVEEGAQAEKRKPRNLPPPLSNDSVEEIGPEEISVEELAENLKLVVVIDIRNVDFAGGHIPGAVRAPFDKLLEDPEYFSLLSNDWAGDARVVFCCMNGERSILCAKHLSFEWLHEKLESDSCGVSRPRVGFLVGGLCSWVNHFNSIGVDSLRQQFEEFEPTYWKAEEGLLVHVSASNQQDLLTSWRASGDLSESIRNAKPLLVHSRTVTLQAAEEVLAWQRRTLGGIMSPDDIDIDHEAIIGSGSTALVVKARQRSTGTPLAAKMMKLDDPLQRRHLLNSLMVFAGLAGERLKIEGIMQLQGILVDSVKVSLVLDFMDIGAVSNLLRLNKEFSSSGGGLPESVLQHTLRQPICGLRYLHAHDLLHRDVKPDNILANSKGEVRLADFGLSKHLEQAAVEGQLSRAKTFVGTQGYLSPQRSKGSAYSVKEDVWALGIVIYELATSEHPLKESSASPAEFFGTLWEKMQEDAGENAGLALPAGDFSEELREVVVACLRKRPSRRLSAPELAACKFWNQMDAISSQGVWDSWLARAQFKKS